MKTFQQWLETRMDGMPVGRESPWFGCRKCGKRTEETSKNRISRLCDECEKKKVTEATGFIDRYQQLYGDDKPMPGRTYEYYLRLFTKLAHKQGRELTQDELKALERHKLNDIQAST